MTPDQITFFRENGYLHLKDALGKDAVAPVKQHILDELKRLNVWASGKALSSRMKDVPAFQQVTKLNQMIKYPGLQERLISKNIIAAMEMLAGEKLVSAKDAQLLLSLPNQGKWSLQNLNWHLDIAVPKSGRVPGVQAFVLIDDVNPQAGATLAVAGSHQLKPSQGYDHDRGKPQAHIYELLKSNTSSKVTYEDQTYDILEMSGRAGDIYLMDMRLIHTPSINASKNIRMMATGRFLIK